MGGPLVQGGVALGFEGFAVGVVDQSTREDEVTSRKNELAVEVEAARDLVDAALDLVVEDEGDEDLFNLVG